MKFRFVHFFLFVFCFFCVESARAAVTSNSKSALAAIHIYPTELKLRSDAKPHRILVTGESERHISSDQTAAAALSIDNPAIAVIDKAGVIKPVGEGKAVLTAKLGGRSASIEVHVLPARVRPLSFTNDILPILSRAGCNAGECHAKASGQAGFKLSVFAHDPVSDYRHIVKEDRGRRISPAAPDQSLFLLKPTLSIKHGGGQRFSRDSEFYYTLQQWIASGLPYEETDEPKITELRVFPPDGIYPKESTQPLIVQARYSDGSVRDVTELASYRSNNPEIVAVGEDGRLRMGTLSGENAVVARYMGLVDVARVAVPADKPIYPEHYFSLPTNNEIDRLVYRRLMKLGIFPSAPCDDATYLRRASLDIAGSLPTVEETRAFLADTDPKKRVKLVDRLLADPRYADFWATKWGDLIRPNPARVGVKSVYVFDLWIRRSFRENKPYDQFVREIITAQGTTHRDGPSVVFRDRTTPEEVTTLVSQIFLGVRMECAKCHHHPNEKWSQQDFYQLASFFGEVGHKGTGLSPPISGSTEFIYHRPGGKVSHPITGEVMKPVTLTGEWVNVEGGIDPRVRLADWMTRLDNPFFAHAIVNRVWADLMGRGIVEPVDDFRASNPASNPALLDWLAADFVKHDFDLKHLIKTITTSAVYQQSSESRPENIADNENFARSYRRRLRAEVLLDAVSDLTGTHEEFKGLPFGARAIETWSNNIPSPFMDAFGRPDSSQDCTCERDSKTSLVQALHLMNSDGLQALIADPTGRVANLVKSEDVSIKAIIEDIYLAGYSRPPTPDELAKASEIIFNAPGASRQTAAEDIMWMVVNSAEFVFNH